jgi:hypothetical protein
MKKIKSLTAYIVITSALTFWPTSLGSIKPILDNAVISISLVELATKFLDKED